MFLRFQRMLADLQRALYTPTVGQLFTIVFETAGYIILLYIWQSRVLPAEKGQYSPFENGLSLIRYVGLVIILNFAMSAGAYRRQQLWIWLPLIANIFILGLCGFYLVKILTLH